MKAFITSIIVFGVAAFCYAQECSLSTGSGILACMQTPMESKDHYVALGFVVGVAVSEESNRVICPPDNFGSQFYEKIRVALEQNPNLRKESGYKAVHKVLISDYPCQKK
jgi:hypothetical protein